MAEGFDLRTCWLADVSSARARNVLTFCVHLFGKSCLEYACITACALRYSPQFSAPDFDCFCSLTPVNCLALSVDKLINTIYFNCNGKLRKAIKLMYMLESRIKQTPEFKIEKAEMASSGYLPELVIVPVLSIGR